MAIFDVVNFGARGDGLTDDTAAIRKAIAAMVPQSMLVFPPGTYQVSGALEFALSDIAVIGAGMGVSVIDSSETIALEHTLPTYGTLAFNWHDNIRLENLTVKCSNDPAVPDLQKAIFNTNCKNITIKNIQVIGSTREAIYTEGSIGENITVQNCDISGHGMLAINCNSATNTGFRAIGNYIHDGGGGITADGISLLIADNIITRCSGQAAIMACREQFDAQYIDGLIIRNNHISDFGKDTVYGRYGIAVNVMPHDEAIIIEGNIISRMHEATGQACRAIYCTGGDGLIISHNIITDCLGDAGEGVGISTETGIVDSNIIRGAGWKFGMICSGATVRENVVAPGCLRVGGWAYLDQDGTSDLIDNQFWGPFIHGGKTYNWDLALNGTHTSKYVRVEL